jgi:hypothetical protein
MLGALSVSGAPRQVFRVTRGGLAPGDYRLRWAVAGCSDQPQGDGDEGDHGDSYEDIVTHEFRLPDCDAQAAAPRVRPRPLIPLDPGVPPNGPIACPTPKPAPCGAATRGAGRRPIIPVRAGEMSVTPCEKPAAPAQPALSAKCLAAGGARAAAVGPRPVMPVRPGSGLPRSTEEECWAEIELRAAPAQQRACPRRAPQPLVPVTCRPEPVDPAMGYVASTKRLKRVRVRIDRGTTETIVIPLTKAQRRAATRKGTAVTVVLRMRDASGRVHSTTSEPYQLKRD